MTGSTPSAELRQAVSPYLLSIRGTLAPATLDAARAIHNQTAGAPPSVEAARSLGDLSHMVYVPLERPSSGAGEFLILDLWNSVQGLGQFFANPHVQEGAGLIFTQRDPVVWAPSESLLHYYLPVPHGVSERYVAVVRGTVVSTTAAETTHNEVFARNINRARLAGNVSHEAYFRAAEPGTPEAREFFAVDVWSNLEGMGNYYAEPAFNKAFDGFFTAEADMSAWVHPAGEWIEW